MQYKFCYWKQGHGWFSCLPYCPCICNSLTFTVQNFAKKLFKCTTQMLWHCLLFSPDVAVIDDAQSNSFRNVIRMSLYWHEWINDVNVVPKLPCSLSLSFRFSAMRRWVLHENSRAHTMLCVVFLRSAHAHTALRHRKWTYLWIKVFQINVWFCLPRYSG